MHNVRNEPAVVDVEPSFQGEAERIQESYYGGDSEQPDAMVEVNNKDDDDDSVDYGDSWSAADESPDESPNVSPDKSPNANLNVSPDVSADVEEQQGVEPWNPGY